MRFPLALLASYLVLFTVCAINPYSREVWVAENLPIVLAVITVAIFSRYHRFSNLAYGLMAVLVMLHTIGGHYTFARVPFGFITELFHFERNHFDRMCHFVVGFYAFPIAELIAAKNLVRSRVILYLFPIFAIVTIAAVYEIFEWRFALSAEPNAGSAVLGAQGDQWDAQKDMLADTLGALFAMLLFWIHEKRSGGRPAT